MADGNATIWAAIVAGMTTLLGVGLGSWLGYGATRRTNEQQAKESRKTRKIAQLERLDRIIEDIDKLVSGLLAQSIGYIGHGFKFDGNGLTKTSLVECEFLACVYLPETTSEIGRLRQAFAEIGRIVGEIVVTKGDQQKGSSLLVELIEKKGELDAATKNIREALFRSAKEIEMI